MYDLTIKIRQHREGLEVTKMYTDQHSQQMVRELAHQVLDDLLNDFFTRKNAQQPR